MRKIAILLLAVFIFVSCTKDHNDVINTELEGKWTLTNVTCFCGFGEDPNFGNHKITFVGSHLNVENSGENQFLTNAAGAYTVNGNLITLTNGQQYTYVIKENKLELTFVDEPNIADDELFLEYERS